MSTENRQPREVINIIGQGVNDPHVHVFEGRAYLYASHDYSLDNTRFVMKDWQVWSSDDLLNWRLESTLKPEDTYIGKPIDGCWATDAVEKNGKYYWAFSEVSEGTHHQQIGMVVSNSPGGPWMDVLGKPLLPAGCVETEVYDPCFFKEDDGDVYILFGVWQYYIAKMSDDMLSLAETPRPITVLNPEGPYGKGKTDDKVSLHKRKGLYYLSWGAYYATSETLEGPFDCRGCIIDPDKMEARFRNRTWPHGPQQGRHGNYFEWKGAWYFTYCEMAFSNNRYFRDFWISPVHYRPSGEIETIFVNSDAIHAKAMSKQ
jgi:arabinoxylan arabinofuranohydrolase